MELRKDQNFLRICCWLSAWLLTRYSHRGRLSFNASDLKTKLLQSWRFLMIFRYFYVFKSITCLLSKGLEPLEPKGMDYLFSRTIFAIFTISPNKLCGLVTKPGTTSSVAPRKLYSEIKLPEDTMICFILSLLREYLHFYVILWHILKFHNVCSMQLTIKVTPEWFMSMLSTNT